MKRLLLTLLIFTITIAKAQQFGGNPPSIKWKQIKTPETRVIFSQGMDSVAQHVAATILQMNNLIEPTIGFKQRQVNIVLQNQTTVSNAYVGLAPFRSEFYLTPSQNSFDVGSLPWWQQLAIHEFRHVQQYNNFNVGFSRVLRVVFGEGGQALGNAMTVPDWFFEGDAVFNETLVSNQGRGRLPYFFNGYRSLWAAGKDYSWMKLRNGSYLDFTPNHYPLGYMMVAYGREKYGDVFWKDVTHDAAAFKGIFYPLQGAIKKYSGQNYTTYRNSALDYFKEEYKDDAQVKLKSKHFVADEEYPAYVNDSTLVYLRTAYNHVPKFVIREGGKERSLAVQSVTNDNYFNYNDGEIVYSSYRPDLRWGYRNYGELRVLDIVTGKERLLTRKTKYFAPSFSDDNKTIVAIDVPATGLSRVHLLDAQSGKRLTAIPNPDHLFYTYPQFYGADQIIAAVRNNKGEMSVAVIDAKTGSNTYLLPFSYEPVAFPQVKGDTVYFSKTNGKNDELFAINVKTRQVFSVAGAPKGLIGYYQPNLSNARMAFTTFTANGYQVKQIALDSIQLIATPLSVKLSDMGVAALEKDSASHFLNDAKPQQFAETKYSKAHGLFNFHSIFPTINDPNYSLELAGQNILNTLQSSLLFNYNRDEGYKQIGYEATYGGLFPYISAGGSYIIDRRGFYKGNSIYYNETTLQAGLQLPFNLSAGKDYTRFSVGSSINYSRNTFQQAYRSMFKDADYTYVSNTFNFSHQIQQARQQINPRFAQSLTVNYKTALWGKEASQLLAVGALYLPGLSMNHSLVISGAYQQKGKNNTIGFSNDFPFSYGYTAESLDRMQRIAANYHFPLAYPDAGLGNLIYLLRLRVNVFFDYTHATADNLFVSGVKFKGDFRSAGGAIFFDTRWFNQGAVSFGIRYSRLLDADIFGGTGRNRVEVVLPVTIF
ncbi:MULTISPECIES: TolB family protein [unclassified Mucilaginibacter]|uniref:TolB family protein n=1 Tax=unclassified Mucilaginibacter TaxID=2617802 RepID=UPI00096317E2|nr:MULTISPECIES: hypothetical protein [unclassified Mucilaginibacter]OJW18075.1 MAG: hypothetical protein BGO48_15985 [Mucilaginibacter sp. 44-25]PLW90313.1 MAG: hypothetical protein C0154_06935 [Mucilaginibacter sp.]HEK19921.1 hypothetical protein [Bacteroidota bacterium]